jgi:hypothetical protein
MWQRLTLRDRDTRVIGCRVGRRVHWQWRAALQIIPPRLDDPIVAIHPGHIGGNSSQMFEETVISRPFVVIRRAYIQKFIDLHKRIVVGKNPKLTVVGHHLLQRFARRKTAVQLAKHFMRRLRPDDETTHFTPRFRPSTKASPETFRAQSVRLKNTSS